MAVASNLPFSEWGKVIPDARLVSAVVDRVTFNAHIIETGTESYRLRIHPPTTPNRWGQISRAGWGQSGLTFPLGLLEPPAHLMEWRRQMGDKVLSLWAELGKAATDDELAVALARLARRGNEMLGTLRDRLDGPPSALGRVLEGAAGVRLLVRDLDTDVPLEFMHDGPLPDPDEPALCDEFHAALKSGACRQCPDRGNDICGFDFWGIRRRIERRVVDRRDASATTPAAVRAGTSWLSTAMTPAVFGASEKLSETDRRETIARLHAVGAEDVVDAVEDWRAWVAALGDRPHRLLVLLSHTKQGLESALEINGHLRDRVDFAQQSDYVNPSGAVPGPITLLTGCETARPTLDFLSFVAAFLTSGAAVVVGTLASIRDDVGAAATGELLNAIRSVLDEVEEPEDRTVGEVMRRTRCRLLAGGT